MAILFHPTHRKFIQLLRTHADRGTIIKYTDLDKKRVRELFFRTNNALERHKSIYKIALEILNRNTPVEEGCALTHDMVDIIEKHLVQAERRKPCNTFQGVVIMPLLQILIKKSKIKGKNNHSSIIGNQ